MNIKKVVSVVSLALSIAILGGCDLFCRTNQKQDIMKAEVVKAITTNKAHLKALKEESENRKEAPKVEDEST